MRLRNCNGGQDAILTECESFGGKAAEAAEVAEDLDSQLVEALDRIAELEKENEQLKANQ